MRGYANRTHHHAANRGEGQTEPGDRSSWWNDHQAKGTASEESQRCSRSGGSCHAGSGKAPPHEHSSCAEGSVPADEAVLGEAEEAGEVMARLATQEFGRR